MTSWPVGELVRAIQTLELPYTITPGYYRLTLARKDHTGRNTDATLLGLVEVQDYPPVPVAQHIPNLVSCRAGTFSLLGYALEQPPLRDIILSFHVYWRADSRTPADGVLYLHIFKPDGSMAASDDNPPDQGRRSTLTYRAGDGIDQLHRIVIPKDAPSGIYKMYTGIYNRGDKERWLSEQDGRIMRDKELYLGEFTLPDN